MKNGFNILSLMVLVTIFAYGCSGKNEAPTVNIQETSAEVKETSLLKTFDPATAATIKGKIIFQGEAPVPQELSVKGNPECAAMHEGGSIKSEELLVSNGFLQNGFVYVKEGLEGQSFPTPSESVTIENKQCVYAPHVVGVQVNQPVIFLNSDQTLHNIHSYSKNSKSFNLGLPFQNMKQTKKFQSPETMVTLKCDVHPWMSGYLGVLPHPYFSVSNAEGNFELRNLPPGKYLIEAWHEKLGAQSQEIEIGPQETREIQFSFSA